MMAMNKEFEAFCEKIVIEELGERRARREIAEMKKDGRWAAAMRAMWRVWEKHEPELLGGLPTYVEKGGEMVFAGNIGDPPDVTPVSGVKPAVSRTVRYEDLQRHFGLSDKDLAERLRALGLPVPGDPLPPMRESEDPTKPEGERALAWMREC